MHKQAEGIAAKGTKETNIIRNFSFSLQIPISNHEEAMNVPKIVVNSPQND